MTPEPLNTGHLLAERFEIRRTLGRGGFGIVYLAEDLDRDDEVVVKELAPEGSRRDSRGVLDLSSGGAGPQMLRRRFLDEARMLGKLNAKGVLPVRSSFTQNGTAYFVTEHLAGSETLNDRLSREHRMNLDSAIRLFMDLLDVLEAVHGAGILHRDIKPSNILIGQDGSAYLIDFGAAREFLHDSSQTQTVMYTPGYAPPEQLSERAKRGPATDLFAFAATLYHMLAGVPPLDVAERMAGEPLIPLAQVRPDVPRAISETILGCLSLSYAERPQSAEELRTALKGGRPKGAPRSVEELDEMLYRSKHFKFDRRGCPNCHEPLEEARPLRKLGCPVCRRGVIRSRKIHDGLCPVCKIGLVRELKNSGELIICPICTKGVLSHHRKGLIAKEQIATCPECSADFHLSGDVAVHGSDSKTIPAWVAQSGRTEKVAACRECQANFDVLADGRWSQISPKPTGKFQALFPEEWSRVASGLDPSVGNAECASCGADYYIDGDLLTLTDAPEDPHGFAAEYLGRALTVESARWLAIGKESLKPGLVCDDCGTEFDHDGAYLRLVQSPSRRLAQGLGQPKKMEDWHRLAQGLPTIDREAGLEEELQSRIGEAYLAGEIGFESPDTAWKGPAVRDSDGTTGTLLISDSEISFGGLLRKWRAPTDSIVSILGQEDALEMQLSGSRESISFDLERQTLFVGLQSGQHQIELGAPDLALRLSRRIKPS